MAEHHVNTTESFAEKTKRKEKGPPPRDPTLQHPHCVYQILRRHYAAYTPEMVERTTGCPRDVFVKVAEALARNSGRERTGTICYAVGWTHHQHAALGRCAASNAAAFAAWAMASGAAALTIAGQGRRASDNTGQALDLIALVASTLELFLLLSLRHRFREQGVDGALNESGWGLAYDFDAVALGAGVPMLHHL